MVYIYYVYFQGRQRGAWVCGVRPDGVHQQDPGGGAEGAQALWPRREKVKDKGHQHMIKKNNNINKIPKKDLFIQHFYVT